MPDVRTFTTTAQEVIDRVKLLTNDSDADRHTTDSEIFLWISDCLDALLVAKPRLFQVAGTHLSTAGYRQKLGKNRAVGIVDVVGALPLDIPTLDQFNPGWRTNTTASATPQHWSTSEDDPTVFYVYPPLTLDASVPVLYIEAPPAVTSGAQVLPVPESYLPAIAAYCVSMAQAKDEEHVVSGRSTQYMQTFIAAIGGTPGGA